MDQNYSGRWRGAGVAGDTERVAPREVRHGRLACGVEFLIAAHSLPHEVRVSVIVVLIALIASVAGPRSGAAPVPGAAPAPRSAAQRHVVQHLNGALRLLERRDLSALTPEQRGRRAEAIAALKAYRDRGRFPENRDFPGEFVPYFIDPVTDAHCAMGHLMAQTGHGALARRIAAVDNHVRVLDLRDDAEVVAWLESNGITLEEAARIQPSYGGGGGPIIPPPGGVLPFPEPQPEEPLTNATALASAMGVSGVLLLAQQFTRLGAGSRVLPAANFIVGFTTTALAVVSNEAAGLRAATGAIGVLSAVSGLSGLQNGGPRRAATRRLQWRVEPARGGRGVFASANWRF